MRYVVTGATGCLGMNLTKRLVHDGHQVLALGRNPQLGSIITQMGAEFIALDLSDLARLKKVASGADALFHCAALSSPWGRYKDFYLSNVIGTKHVIEATGKNTRLIHVSSPSIYFDFTEKHNIKESSPLPAVPANHYIKTKLLAESLIDDAHYKRDLNVVTIRPRAIFGSYDRAIIPRLLKVENKGILPIIGTGNNMIDITFVDNVVESMILVANAKSLVCGKKYNITNDEPKSLIEIISLLYRALNKTLKVRYVPYSLARCIAQCLELIHHIPFLGEPRITRYSSAVLALGQTLNIDAAKQDFHYKPILSIENGMQQFANWYLSA